MVRLAELPALFTELARRVRAADFKPDVLVYIETGARVPATALCRELGLKAVPVVARRPGQRLKALVTPLVAWLPRRLTAALRRAEESTGVHANSGRQVTFPVTVTWAGRNILIVDDASDTGATLRVVKSELVARGADPARIRCAVLAATLPGGRAEADFYVLDRNHVLPWSSDSDERRAVRPLLAQTPPAL